MKRRIIDASKFNLLSTRMFKLLASCLLSVLLGLTALAQESPVNEEPQIDTAGTFLIEVDMGSEQPVRMLAVLNRDGTFQASAVQPLAADDLRFRSDLVSAEFLDNGVQHFGAWTATEEGEVRFNALSLSGTLLEARLRRGGAVIRTSGTLKVDEGGDAISGELSQRFFLDSDDPLLPETVAFAELGPYPFTGRRISAEGAEETALSPRAGQPKIDICHVDQETGDLIQISIAQPAFPAHLEHGDFPVPTWYQDVDQDGVGNPAVSLTQCDQPDGYVPAGNGEDCNDAASSCTSDCVSDADGDGRADCLDQCLDADGDGYGADNSGITVGTAPDTVGQCTTDGSTGCDLGPACLGPDCDDTDPAINPAAVEVCDFVDNNCDGMIDEGFDQDGDGFKTCEDDCDDNDPTVNPGESDALCNGIDNNCDGMIDEEYMTTPTMCGVGQCADTGNLICSAGMEQDTCTPGTPVPEVCGDGLDNDCDGVVDNGCDAKIVFVSSQLFDGNFGNGQDAVLGHLFADNECQALANTAGLSGTFKAWISGRVDTGEGPLFHGVDDRFTMATGPYELLDGTKVADNWTDLTDGSLDHAIDRTEFNMPVSGEMRVWTNTRTNAQAWDNGRNCATGPSSDGFPGITSWSCGAPDFSPGDCANQSGKFGMANATDGSWTGTESSNTACTAMFRLYCFEQ